jgi:bifunctional DNA-binding transcriptional regulator/antitoxin component of YhaV-PrlF toxin-antitoxin module
MPKSRLGQVTFLGEIKMDAKGRVLIPKKAMRALGLTAQMQLSAMYDGEGNLILRPIKNN